MMANTVTPFAADEGVSRANFNSRIDEINAGIEAAQSAAENAAAAAEEAQNTATAANETAENHTQAASTITAGTFAGKVVANATATATVTAAQVRNIYAGTGAMTAGTTKLTTGVVYVQYE